MKSGNLIATLIVSLVFYGCSSSPEIVQDDSVSLMPTQPSVQHIPIAAPELTTGAHRLNGVAAVVNNEIITFNEVMREAVFLEAEATKKGVLPISERLNLRRTVLDRLIEKHLTEQKAKELGIEIGSDEVRHAIEDVKRQNNNMTQAQLEAALQTQGFSYAQYEAQVREQLERTRLISIEVKSKVNITDQDIETYYNEHLSKFAEEQLLRARHIYIKMDKDADDASVKQAMAKALNILHDAKSGKDFAELARHYSDDPGAINDGGDLGFFKHGDMLAEFENALMPLKPGEVGELVVTPSGLHVVKLEERSATRYKPLEAVKYEIEEQLYRAKQEARFAQWMKELRSQASVDIRDDQGIF